MQVNRHISGEVLWVAVGVLISMAVVLAGTRILTSVLSLTEYGRLALMISFAGLFDQVAGHAIGGAAMRFYSVYNVENRLADLRGIIFRLLLVSALFCFIGALVISVLQWPEIDLLLILAFAFSTTLLVSGVGIRLAEGARRRKVSAVLKASFELLRFGLAAFFIYFGANTAESAMCGFVLGGAIIACIHLYHMRNRLLIEDRYRGEPKKNQLAYSFRKYAKPLLIVGFGTWVYLMSPLWALGWFCDISEVGGYAAYHQLAFVPMLVISGILLTFLAPIVYETTLQSADKAMKDSFRLITITLIVVCFVAIIAYIGHRPAAALLLGENFRSNSWMFPWLIIAGGFYGVAQQLLLRLRAEMKILKLAIIQLVFALMAIVFYSFVAKHFSVDGVVYAVATLNALLLVLAFVFADVIKITARPSGIS